MSNQDQNKNIEIKVGLFVATGIFLFIFSLFSIREGFFIFNSQYILKVKMSSVEGLGPGSIVQLLGVPVGNVKSVDTLPSENKVLLNLRIDRNYQDMITKGSQVRLKTQGALGDRFVSIEPNTEEATEILKDGDFLIFKPETDVLSTLLSGGDKIEHVFQILEELSILIKSFNNNNQTIEIMNNLNESSKELKGLLTSTHILTKNIERQKTLTKSLRHFSSILEKIDNGQGTLGALINDATIYNRIDNLLSGSERNTYVKGLVRKSIQTGKN